MSNNCIQTKIDETVINVLQFVFRYYFTEGTGNDVMFDLDWQQETREKGIIVLEIEEIDIEKYKTLRTDPLPMGCHIDLTSKFQNFTQDNMIDMYEDQTVSDILLTDKFWNEIFCNLIYRELVTCCFWERGIWKTYKSMNNQLNRFEKFSTETISILGTDICMSLEYGLGKYIVQQYKNRYIDIIRNWVVEEFLCIIPK